VTLRSIRRSSRLLLFSCVLDLLSEFKKTLAANMVMLGAVAAITKVAKLESLKMSVREVAPKASRDLNTRALERGFEWAVANLKKP
jgi:Pyruvate/2-oxoacid:ferredoxin oxidoreductase gamma subunit